MSLLWPDPTVQTWLSIADLPVSLAIQITLIVFLSRGANGSRIVLTIFTAYGPVDVIQALPKHSSTVPHTVLVIVSLVLEVAATVLLYLPPANASFAAVRAEAVKRRFSDAPPDHPVAP